MCCASILSAVCNATLCCVLPRFAHDPACLQGPIYKSIEWLDRTGMDIIESVSKTCGPCADAARHQLISPGCS